MNFEQVQNTPKSELSDTQLLASEFKGLTATEPDSSVFEHLDNILEKSGYEIASMNNVSGIFNNNSLYCRSENFSKVLTLISDNTSIGLVSKNNRANMCQMSSSRGFRVAMTEGFTGQDTGNIVKSVISFSGDSMTKNNISKDSELWELKPDTASVSLSGEGKINKEDIEMISFRFPIHFFPEDRLCDDEMERKENNESKFIVRHYTPKKTTH